MANRFWVGGTANWDATAGTKWATTSGGAGGASVPTSADNVFFDAASGVVTVTVAAGNTGCADLDFTGFTGTFAGSSALTIAGNLTLATGMTRTYTGSVTFSATTTGKTITTNGKSLGSVLNFNGIGGEWILQDNLTLDSSKFIVLFEGILNTNGKTVTAYLIQCTTGNPTLTLGASTINLENAVNFSGNITLNAGTSTINLDNSSGGSFQSLGLVFNNVIINNIVSSCFITGTNTFTNLTLNGAASGTPNANLSNNQTVTGTFTASGANSSKRLLINSNTVGVTQTITAGIVSLTDVDFTDIIGAGVASPFTGTRIGKRRTFDISSNFSGQDNCSGITFTTATNKYWVGGSGDINNSTNHWATTSGGSAGINNYPLPQDNVIFDNLSSSNTYLINFVQSLYCNDFTANAPSTGYVSFDSNGFTVTMSGSLLLNVGTVNGTDVFTSGFNFNFNATSSVTITTNSLGSTNGWSGNQTFCGNGGTWTLQDNFCDFPFGSSASVNLILGTLALNGHRLEANIFTVGTLFTTVLDFGTGGSLSTSSSVANAIDLSVQANFTVNNSSTGDIYLFVGGFFGGGRTYRDFSATLFSPSFGNTGIFDPGNTFRNVTIILGNPGVTGAGFLFNTTTITGIFSTSGTTSSDRILIKSDTSGIKRTITAASVSITDVDFWDIDGAGVATWSGTRIGDGGNNSGITFATGVNKYWVGNSANWNTASWATTSGGAGSSTNYPLPQDTAVFDSNSFSANDQTITIDRSGTRIPSINFSGITKTGITLANTFDAAYYGNVVLGSSMVVTNGSNTAFRFNGGNTKNITSSGITFSAIDVDCGNGTVILQDNLATSTTIGSRLTSGILNLNGHTLTIFTMTSSNTNTRSITSVGGSIIVTGSNTTVWTSATATNFSLNDALTVNITTGTSGTRTINHGATSVSGTESNSPSFNISGGVDTVTFVSNSFVKNLDFTGFSGTLFGGGRTIYGNLILSTGMTLQSSTTATTFSSTSGIKTITTNGKIVDFPLTFNGIGGTWQLVDNLTLGSVRNATLTNGTLNLNGNTLTANIFSSSNGNTRAITSGGGSIVLGGNGTTIWSVMAATNFILNDALQVISNYSGATGTRTLAHGTSGGATEANTPNFNITAGTDTLSPGSSGNVKTIDFTGFSGTLSNAVVTVWGSLILSTGMALTATTAILTFAATSGIKTITTNGKTLDRPITFNGVGGTWQLVDPLTIGSTRTLTLTNGTFDFNGQAVSTGAFSSSNSNTRSLTSGGSTLTLTGNGITIWNTGTITNFTLNDALQINANYSGSVGIRTITSGSFSETNAPNLSITAGTDTVSISNSVKTLDWSGFAGTWSAIALTIYGNLIVSSGMSVTATTSVITLAATSGIKTITTNGKTIDRPITFDGVGGTWQFTDNFTLGSTRTATLTNGTLDINGKTVVVGRWASNNSNIRTIKSSIASGVLRVIDTASATIWDMTITNSTLDRTNNNWQIFIDGNTTNIRTFSGGGHTYPSVNFTNVTANGGLTIAGNNTFKSLAYTGGTAQTIRFSVSGSTTIEDDNGFLTGTAGHIITINTNTGAGTFTLIKSGTGKIASDYLNITNSTATPNTPNWTWYAGENSVINSNVLGWAPRDVPTYEYRDFADFCFT